MWENTASVEMTWDLTISSTGKLKGFSGLVEGVGKVWG